MHHEACVAWQTIKKYIDLLQSVANRRERVVEIELDDVFNYFGGDEMAEKIRRNTYRYKQLICQAIDRCSSAQKPHPQPRAQPRARARARRSILTLASTLTLTPTLLPPTTTTRCMPPPQDGMLGEPDIADVRTSDMSPAPTPTPTPTLTSPARPSPRPNESGSLTSPSVTPPSLIPPSLTPPSLTPPRC